MIKLIFGWIRKIKKGLSKNHKIIMIWNKDESVKIEISHYMGYFFNYIKHDDDIEIISLKGIHEKLNNLNKPDILLINEKEVK